MTEVKKEHQNRKVKILATLGPASSSVEALTQLIESGANCFRFNFSHGTHDSHFVALQNLREASKITGKRVGVFQDLCGPKIRIAQGKADKMYLVDNKYVEIRPGFKKGEVTDETVIYVEGLNPVHALEVGHNCLLADGMVALKAESKSSESVICRVVKGGRVGNRCGIAFPDTTIDLPATTEKDLKDLEWGLKNNVDFVALSFVQNAADAHRVRKILNDHNSQIKLVAKVERKKSIDNIDEIIDAFDGVMVARGDLGLELPLQKVPFIQKDIIEKCNDKGKIVITATQMLYSMVTSLRPTRAEVSDVANAVLDGTDVVMLSEETAVGEHPSKAVEYLGSIALEAEKDFEFEEFKLRLINSGQDSVPDAVAYAACAAAVKLKAKAIIACTDTGHTARLTAKYRPQIPLYAVSSKTETLTRLSLVWGVNPLMISNDLTSHADELDNAINAIKKEIVLEKGDRIVIIGGRSAFKPGSTSMLEVVEI